MNKRILAIALALAVMLVSLPVLPINIGGINAGATAAPGDIDLEKLNWPQYAVASEWTDFSGWTNDGGGTWTTENAFGTNSGSSYMNPPFAAYLDADTTGEIVDGAVRFYPKNNNELNPYIWMNGREGDYPTVAANALSIHVSFKGITSKAEGAYIPWRFSLGDSCGSSGHYTAYILGGKTYYFIPDATEENPNPEMKVLKTEDKTGVNSANLAGYAGQSGTYIIPFDVFDPTTETTSDVTNYTPFTNAQGHISGRTIYTLYMNAGTGAWKQRSIMAFNIYNDSYATTDYFEFDDVKWVTDAVNYDFQTITQDFSNFTLNPNAQWMYGNYGTYGNNPNSCFPTSCVTLSEGRLALTPNDTATDGSSMHFSFYDIGQWFEDYKAFAYDLDLSELTGSHYARIYFHGYNDGSTTSFKAYGGTIYLLSDDGTLSTIVNTDTSSSGQCFWTLPAGFKGRVIIPATVVKNASGTGLHDQYKKLTFYFELRDWKAADTGESYYMDNLGFYFNAPGLEEGAGTDFSKLENSMYETSTINGNIRTVEAWVKTTATTDQMFIAEKYDIEWNTTGISNPYHIEDVQFTKEEPAEGEKPYGKNLVCKEPGFRVGMTAAGYPYFFMADEKCNFINFTCTDAVINDGEWKHVAFVIDETMNEIRCYVNGVNVGYQSFVSPTDESVIYKIPENDLSFPITVGNHMPKNGRVNIPFNGTIANVRIWSDVRTGKELFNNSVASVAGVDNLIAEWMLTGENFTEETTGTYDLTEYQWDITSENPLYADYNRDAAEDEFTVVFMPDTQIVNRYSATQYAAMYQWILDNQERLNIKVVMGLGDIVDENDKTVQWENAQAAHNNLTANGMPWVIATGNHDYSSLGKRENANFKKYFTTDMLVKNDYFQLGATYASGDLSSAYYYFTPNGEDGVKYLLLTLETEPPAGVLDWARQIIGNHSDYRVIITTHEYMNAQNRIFTHDTKDMYTGSSSGEQIWNGLLKDYENIDMIVCGHSSFSGIINRVAQGENGNDVYQILCDTQQIDYAYNYAAAVLIGRFKNDGSEVSFNLYSTNADSFMGTDNNNLTLDLGSAEDELVDDLVSDNYGTIEGMFHSQSIQRDYNYFSTSEFKGSGYNDQEKDTFLKPTWNNGSIKATATLDGKANYNSSGVQTSTGQTEGYWGFGLLKLPATVKGDGTTALAIHVDGSGLSTNRAFRMYFDTDGDGSWEINTEIKQTTYYTMSDDNPGVYTKNTADSVVYINKDFKGYIIFPMINEKNGNTDAEAYKADTANNNAQLRFQGYYGYENTTGDYLILDEYSFLQGGPIAVPFKDYDDKVLSTIITEPGANITSMAPAEPTRHGYKFAGWENIELPDAYEALGVKALYTKDTETTYEVAPNPEVEVDVNVVLPAGQDKPYYNDRITISAPKVNAEGQKFSYWKINGAKFSTSARLSFLVFDEMDIVPVYADEVEETPVLVYTNPSRNYVIKNGKWNFQIMGVVEAGDAEVTEIGVLLSASEMDAETLRDTYKAETEAGVEKRTVVKQAVSGATNGRQFLFTFTGIAYGQTRCATTYAILSDGTMVIGDAVTCITIDANGALAE